MHGEVFAFRNIFNGSAFLYLKCSGEHLKLHIHFSFKKSEKAGEAQFILLVFILAWSNLEIDSLIFPMTFLGWGAQLPEGVQTQDRTADN